MITRPLVANIDYLVIQFAAVDPKMDYERFNMLLLNAYYYNIKPIAVINKIDLADQVNASLEVMERDARAQRGDKPFIFTNMNTQLGLDEIISFIQEKGMLRTA